MSGVTKCSGCLSTDIDTDPARGDSVCTNCGLVLDTCMIVSEVTFEEDGHGGASAVGQFVSSDSRGGGGMGSSMGAFHSGVGKESRELTLRAAKKRITDVAQQLRLNQHCVDVAFNFFKMALHKQLTKGRRHPLTIAACVYMTCRMEGTPHLLIDFSDIVQMDVYALGRAYLQISRSLFINIPAVDPCMYILRFAHKFGLGDKTHEVSMTALRLVQRMKRDWIHLGRRPSGLCGAALLIAARLHGFSRTIQNIIGVVKVHETTLRKRLVEFGETPSSSLTLEEFMSVDLEEEHDPPSFKAARIKDREELQKLLDDGMETEMTDIQHQIEEELEKRREKVQALRLAASEMESTSPAKVEADTEVVREKEEASKFITESTLTTIETLMPEGTVSTLRIPKTEIKAEVKTEIKTESSVDLDRRLMPPPSQKPISLEDFELDPTSVDLVSDSDSSIGCDIEADSGDLDLDGIDDDEINGYLMNNVEAERKRILWEKINSEYIELQARKQEQLEQDIKEGKFDKKKRPKKEKQVLRKDRFMVKTANEAIKIMLDKKMSSKINYDVLKRLTEEANAAGGGNLNPASKLEHDPDAEDMKDVKNIPTIVIESGPIVPRRNQGIKEEPGLSCGPSSKKIKTEHFNHLEAQVMIASDSKSIILKPKKEVKLEPVVKEPEPEPEIILDHDEEDDHFESDEDDVGPSARELLTRFRGEEEPSYDDYYD